MKKTLSYVYIFKIIAIKYFSEFWQRKGNGSANEFSSFQNIRNWHNIRALIKIKINEFIVIRYELNEPVT